MTSPRRFLDQPNTAAKIIARYCAPNRVPETSYATVRDYCDSVDHLPQITGLDGDLKNVQRPWTIKALLRNVPPPAPLLEIGGGEPIVSGFLSELGYDVTLVDPYDGSGNGPIDYETYLRSFPNVKIVRGCFEPRMAEFRPASFAGIFSISVLEHLFNHAADSCFHAITEFLAPGGASIHCFDFILQGIGQEHDLTNARNILTHQSRLSRYSHDDELSHLLDRLKGDVDTFFLSPQGHHLWRGGLPYEKFPFRKVVSLQTIALLPAS